MKRSRVRWSPPWRRHWSSSRSRPSSFPNRPEQHPLLEHRNEPGHDASGSCPCLQGRREATSRLTVINGTCNPITAITVTSVQPQLVGVSNASFVSYNDSVVSALTPLPAGQLGTGNLAVSGSPQDRNTTSRSR